MTFTLKPWILPGLTRAEHSMAKVAVTEGDLPTSNQLRAWIESAPLACATWPTMGRASVSSRCTSTGRTHCWRGMRLFAGRRGYTGAAQRRALSVTGKPDHDHAGSRRHRRDHHDPQSSSTHRARDDRQSSSTVYRYKQKRAPVAVAGRDNSWPRRIWQKWAVRSPRTISTGV